MGNHTEHRSRCDLIEDWAYELDRRSDDLFAVTGALVVFFTIAVVHQIGVSLVS